MISVIMPAYNADRFIDEAINSILKQTYQDWNLTIVNDGSTDNTKEVINKFIKEYPDKIFLIDKEVNEGTVSGLNTLIEAAAGEYICWLSADDVYTSDMLEDSVAFLKNHSEFDAVFSDHETIDENSVFLQKSVFKKAIEELKEGKVYQPYKQLLLSGCCIHGCTVMAKSDCFKKVGGFNAKYKYAHDYDMWLRMSAIYNIGYIDRVHVRGREYSWQISQQGNNESDAVNVLFDFIHEEELFTSLYKKAGFHDAHEAIYELIIGQLKAYKHKDKEFTQLMKRLLNEDDLLLKQFRKTESGERLYKTIDLLLKDGRNFDEGFFKDDTKDSYLNRLCILNHADAFLINNQAIRFDRFEGNSLMRFNKGLMRSNDIVLGKVSKKHFLKFVSENKNDYRYYFGDMSKEDLQIGITYFMYKGTGIADMLQMTDIIDTGEDIWWQLCRHIMYDDE